MGGAEAERLQRGELLRVRLVPGVEDEAQAAYARLAEPDKHEAALERHASGHREPLVGIPHERRQVDKVLSEPGGRDRLGPAVRPPEDA